MSSFITINPPETSATQGGTPCCNEPAVRCTKCGCKTCPVHGGFAKDGKSCWMCEEIREWPQKRAKMLAQMRGGL